MIVFFDDKSFQLFELTNFATLSLLHKELWVLTNHNKKAKIITNRLKKKERSIVKRSSKIFEETHINMKNSFYHSCTLVLA